MAMTLNNSHSQYANGPGFNKVYANRFAEFANTESKFGKFDRSVSPSSGAEDCSASTASTTSSSSASHSLSDRNQSSPHVTIKQEMASPTNNQPSVPKSACCGSTTHSSASSAVSSFGLGCNHASGTGLPGSSSSSPTQRDEIAHILQQQPFQHLTSTQAAQAAAAVLTALQQAQLNTRESQDDKLSNSSTDINGFMNKHVPNNLYKTELCRTWCEKGICRYGNKCQFAHGSEELRSLQRHPKYKTEFCRSFHTTGSCPYGSRCHFIHSDYDSQLVNPYQKQKEEREALDVLSKQPLSQANISVGTSNQMNAWANSSTSMAHKLRNAGSSCRPIQNHACNHAFYDSKISSTPIESTLNNNVWATNIKTEAGKTPNDFDLGWCKNSNNAQLFQNQVKFDIGWPSSPSIEKCESSVPVVDQSSTDAWNSQSIFRNQTAGSSGFMSGIFSNQSSFTRDSLWETPNNSSSASIFEKPSNMDTTFDLFKGLGLTSPCQNQRYHPNTQQIDNNNTAVRRTGSIFHD